MRSRALAGVVDWAYGIAWWVRALSRSGTPDAFRRPGPDPAHHTPLVLLPGIWERWRYLVPLARALNGWGHPVHLLESLGGNGGPLPAATRVVVDYLAEHDLSGVVLVAHSKGGLIGKLVMLDPDAGPRVRGMVALSTPFGGSSLSWPVLARSPLGIFAPKGRAILDLAEQRDVNARIVSLQPRHDQVIPEGSRLEGARNVALDVSGHFRPLRDPGVHRVIHDSVHGLT
ncbi:esterase/lipase family protein [Micropruina sonneratiae]|uniref:esterase/lipase family protein n=1 Tax=Micropruina sonneratiae TaxID=2986940 RepID=UPI002226296B|nr:alpha/beta hydrolase [Micropruina sp. KQZ13P-5]MCW3158181.1 alpha/beta hydrolase [Micropruina sp. KQZ13P-5]